MARPRIIILPSFILLLVLTVGACSDNDNPTGTADTLPPGVAAVTPVDELHVDVTFSEEVTISSAEDEGHYLLTESTAFASTAQRSPATAPGDTLRITAVVLAPDRKTASIGTESSMGGLSLSLSVVGVSDAHGNGMHAASGETFTGSSDPDITPPVLLGVSPAPSSTNVSLTTSVTIRFSEAVYASLDYYSDSEAAPFSVHNEGATYTLTPYAPLAYNTVYTFQVVEAQDYAHNSMTSGPWRFTTIASTDTKRPTIVSTTPGDLDTNVGLSSNITITFSEPVNQSFFEAGLRPYPLSGFSTTWSNDDRTVTLNPWEPLLADQQYVLAIDPRRVFDVAGNHIEGLQVVRFTTGSALENGSIHGTLAGEPRSEAADPAGATVVVTTRSMFNESISTQTLGSAIVMANGTYTISYLPDGKYFPFALLDTNGDGLLDPYSGDAIGGYGMDFATRDLEPDSVLIAAGNDVAGVNFPLYDPSAITGTVTYEGQHEAGYAYVFVGLFEPSGFTPADPGEPVATSTYRYSTIWPGRPRWNVNSFVQVIPNGLYYVGAYLDVDDNRIYDPGTEPLGFYGGIDSPTPVRVANGNDVSGLVIPLADPDPLVHSSIRVAWSAPAQNASLERLCDALRRSPPSFRAQALRIAR